MKPGAKTKAQILAGYSMEMLLIAQSDLGKVVQSGRAGNWEKKRYVEINDELDRRKAAFDG